ncbi:hypothetical protein ACFRCI_03550 [Streptomyces sp. NPDC056638]|uniref:hypothetical protein n=1 Tax=Streptomyces sp. NPDC056638 TaxID=3345887 RepID=UPI0036B928F8
MGGTEKRRPYLAGVQDFAAVYDVRGPQVSQWVTRGALTYEHAVIVSGSPYWLLSYVKEFGPARTRPKEPNETVLAELVEQQSPGWWAKSVGELPPIVGMQECEALFGVSQRSLADRVGKGIWIMPDYRLSGSPLWLLDTVLEAEPPASRTVQWVADPVVVAALRERRYEGPGSVIVPRGPAARKRADAEE